MSHKELIRAVTAYLGTLQDDFNEETWCTDRALAKTELLGFLAFLGVKTDAIVAIPINP